MSATLVREEDGSQRPVYFTSRALRGAEERYPQIEKLAFVLIIAARKLKPYFQAHTIVVLTDKPLRKAMSSSESAGRMTLWAVELSKFDIRYCPWTAIKGQGRGGITLDSLYFSLDVGTSFTFQENSMDRNLLYHPYIFFIRYKF